MLEFVKLNVAVLLKHILDPGPTRGPLGELNGWGAHEDSQDDLLPAGGGRGSTMDGEPAGWRKRLGGRGRGNWTARTRDDNNGDDSSSSNNHNNKVAGGGDSRLDYDAHSADLLDFEGPKLLSGVRVWLTFYQLIGVINWIGRPLYVSIVYKFLVVGLMLYVLIQRFAIKFYNLKIVNETYRNPIFLLISSLAFLTILAQLLVSFWANLFDLCPMYKMITTKRLCFIKTDVLKIMGDRSLGTVLIFLVYQTLLISIVVSRNLDEFISQFSLPFFLVDCLCNAVFLYYLIGLAQLDFYIRCAFGHWLLALKSHLEHRFTHLHRHQRRLKLLRGVAGAAGGHNPTLGNYAAFELVDGGGGGGGGGGGKQEVTFDEIQKSLNNMDDHLEALRSIQISSYALLSLNAFLGNGALFLVTYHLLADQSNFYHGFAFLLLSLNYMLIIFMCYSGDRWIYYALSSIVQTVEDEYFMQSDIKIVAAPIDQQQQLLQQQYQQQMNGGAVGGSIALSLSSIERESPAPSSVDLSGWAGGGSGQPTSSSQQMLLIRKKDVLFCREFLHQFENHLATPWSELTFKSHLHMLRAFVTLIAAQIIFDHEH